MHPKKIHTHIHKDVHQSTICNGGKLETIQMPIKKEYGRMNYICNGKGLSGLPKPSVLLNPRDVCSPLSYMTSHHFFLPTFFLLLTSLAASWFASYFSVCSLSFSVITASPSSDG